MGVRHVLAAAACLVWLAGCETTSISPTAGDLVSPTNPALAATDAADPPATGTATAEQLAMAGAPDPATKSKYGGDPYNDLGIGKKLFREGKFGLAEHYFRGAVTANPRDAEAWVGLAACYDRLKRFDLADRAYDEVLKFAGPTPAILNNQGYSYIMRGDYDRAREKLLAARAKDPANPYISANLALLEETERTHKRSGS
jgi:Flp pilus assembly protein TadD